MINFSVSLRKKEGILMTLARLAILGSVEFVEILGEAQRLTGLNNLNHALGVAANQWIFLNKLISEGWSISLTKGDDWKSLDDLGGQPKGGETGLCRVQPRITADVKVLLLTVQELSGVRGLREVIATILQQWIAINKHTSDGWVVVKTKEGTKTEISFL